MLTEFISALTLVVVITETLLAPPFMLRPTTTDSELSTGPTTILMITLTIAIHT